MPCVTSASALERLSDGTGVRVKLRDGRFIGVAEYGDQNGRPLLWFPGTPGSRLAAPPDSHSTREAGVRFIVLERPGFGVSTPLPERRILDWPSDVEQVADALDLTTFDVGGASGAGPYVCACAARLRERVRCALLTGAIGPVSEPALARTLPWRRRFYLMLARHAPALLRKIARQRDYGRDAERLLRDLTADASAADQAVIARIWDRQLRMTAEALRQGSDAFCWELHIGASPWGFELSDIAAPVIIWHGDCDVAAPIELARHVAEHIPNCETHFVSGEGHFLHFKHWEEILRSVSAAR
jgi:pimeloyl-ACP methyl ester carboxylesterase